MEKIKNNKTYKKHLFFFDKKYNKAYLEYITPEKRAELVRRYVLEQLPSLGKKQEFVTELYEERNKNNGNIDDETIWSIATSRGFLV